MRNTSDGTSKSALVVFLQKYMQRTLTKKDLTYHTIQHGDKFQSTVVLVCLDGSAYTGEHCLTEKAAEHAAASRVLSAYADEVAAAPPMRQAPPGTCPKSALLHALQVYCGRTLTKNDVCYSTSPLGDAFVSTVQLNCLQGLSFMGDAAETEKAAQYQAAQVALDQQNSWSPPPDRTLGAPWQGNAQKPPKSRQDRQPDNPKSDLVNVLQGRLRRALTKQDLVWNTSANKSTYTSCVKLVCSRGETFFGDPAQTEKIAEHLAAQNALENQHSWSLPLAQPGHSKKAAVSPASSPPAVDAKSTLTSYISRVVGRPLTGADILYTSSAVGRQHLATVNLTCLDGQMFTGMLSATKKDAEQSAAQQALLARGVPHVPTSKTKRSPVLPPRQGGIVLPIQSGSRQGGPLHDASKEDAMNAKSTLVKFLQKYIGRTLTRHDLVYNHQQIGSEFQASVRLACLDGHEFFGGPKPTQKEAEQSVAVKVLEAYASEVAETAAMPKKRVRVDF
eukprot:TRINITY_DN33313_c0_g1_i1.p1 TRINITY_DN33313_c0_g1~~TRINITY_DN33313_c0_g1_i1.p1  ORF type:complete len:504 (-),score=55.54 TRINITY_DN33313_c0_g1_i1:157-1668(-)